MNTTLTFYLYMYGVEEQLLESGFELFIGTYEYRSRLT